MKLPKNHAKESKKVQSKQKQNRFEMFTQFLHLKYRASLFSINTSTWKKCLLILLIAISGFKIKNQFWTWKSCVRLHHNLFCTRILCKFFATFRPKLQEKACIFCACPLKVKNIVTSILFLPTFEFCFVSEKLFILINSLTWKCNVFMTSQINELEYVSCLRCILKIKVKPQKSQWK